MTRAGFASPASSRSRTIMSSTDLQAYRDKAFSSLHLIDDEAFRARHRAVWKHDLALGPIPCVSLYTMIWARSPKRNRSGPRRPP